MPMMGAEEAQRYLGAGAAPEGYDRLHQTMQRNVDRKQDILRRKGEADERYAGSEWKALEKAYQTGANEYDRSHARGTSDRRLQTEEARAAKDIEGADIRNQMDRVAQNRLQREEEFLAGTEEGQAKTRAQRLAESRYQSDLDRPAQERTERELNAAATRAQIYASNVGARSLEETNRIAQEDRKLTKASEEYAAAMRRNDTRELASLDAKYSQDLGPQGIMRAKDKAQQNLQSGQMASNLFVRGSAEGQAAFQRIGQVSAKAQAAQALARDLSGYLKAVPGSQQEDIEAEKMQTTLRSMGLDREADYVKGGVAGVSGDVQGQFPFVDVSKRSTRAVNTLSKVKADLVKELTEIKTQYGTMPGTEIQGEINRLEQAVLQIEAAERGAKLNSLQLVGGGQGMGSQNAQFLRGGVGSPTPALMQPQMSSGGVPNQINVPGFQQPPPSMRQSMQPTMVPATGATRP